MLQTNRWIGIELREPPMFDGMIDPIEFVEHVEEKIGLK